jgi:hypothetical protein
VALLPSLIEVPQGIINGINTLFQTSASYLAGSVVVFLNGQLKRGDYSDGWVELGNRYVNLKIPPETGDVVQIYYVPT